MEESTMNQQDLAGRCGIYCGECDYRERMNCPGCIQADGNPFWGECQIAKCCTSKHLQHCGYCADLPCDDLNAFAYDAEQGDGGQRILNLEQWAVIGFSQWVQERHGH